MNNSLSVVTRILVAFLASALVSAFFTPLWQILMWAPQYPEGLEMKIWYNNITGSIKIISALNHYIGMRNIEVSMFPEFNYMKYIVGALIGIGLIAALINKRWAVLVFFLSLIATGVSALVDFYLWGYDYGHTLNPEAPIRVPGMSYQPPLIGTKQLLNFTAFSGPDVGGWVFITAAGVIFTLLVYEHFFNKKSV